MVDLHDTEDISHEIDLFMLDCDMEWGKQGVFFVAGQELDVTGEGW